MISDAVVNTGGVLYDPNYGLSFSSLQAYANQMVSGLAFDAPARQSDFGFNPSGGAYDPNALVTLMLFKKGHNLRCGLLARIRDSLPAHGFSPFGVTVCYSQCC